MTSSCRLWVRNGIHFYASWCICSCKTREDNHNHYDDVIMIMLASQITSLTVVYSIVYSGVNLRKHQSSASLAFVWEIHRGPVNFPHKGTVTRKMFPFDDVIMVKHFATCTFCLAAQNVLKCTEPKQLLQITYSNRQD